MLRLMLRGMTIKEKIILNNDLFGYVFNIFIINYILFLIYLLIYLIYMDKDDCRVCFYVVIVIKDL